MEEACLYGRRYTPWDPPPYQHHDPYYYAYQSNGYSDAYYGYKDPPPPHPLPQTDIGEAFHLVTIFTNGNSNNSTNTSPSSSKDLPSQPQSIPKGSINTLFLCTKQEGREDTLNEEVVEYLNHEKVHEFLEEVEVENEEEKVEDENKELKEVEIVHSASSEATPPEEKDGLLETDGQLRALCGSLDKKEKDSAS
ncbi:hypothetical protein PIB30_063968 [Stylosanthes scabra]|uniref:Uncharacterized protein n=1 Tax=Stylosanthes scabra TaxID=79078 RepID=A0ABU6ZKC2_9FABA|nr:hypothetical protein [Stylosanthes scabra]